MSKIIVNEIKPNGGKDLRIVGNTNILGTLNGVTITTLSGATTFTGNTSGTCISQMYIDKLYGCDQEYIDSPNLIIYSDVNVNGNVTGSAFYGDGSNITNLPSTTFTGNTSGDCLQDLWIDNLNGCNGNLIVNGNLNVINDLSATTLYGDSSFLTKTIYDIVPVGSEITSVGAYLEYGINLISTANTSNFCVRLPQTPIEGRQVNVINNSGFDIIVYPSMSGGSINGVVNGSSLVPSDSKKYTFTCYENPAPGSWSANFVQSTNQYDSGVISIDTSLSASPFSTYFGYVVAYDNNFKHVTNGTYYINGYLGGKPQPNIVINNNPLSCGFSSGFCNNIMWKPTTPWSFIDKITVYTNFGQDLSSPARGGFFTLNQTYDISYYDSTTGAWLGTEIMGQGQPANGYYATPNHAYCDQRLSGNLSGFTTNPGDPGTWFGELNYSLSGRPSQIGEVVLGTGNFTFTDWLGNVLNVTNADKIQTKYISFYFQSWQNSPDVKFKFLIDYTV